MIKKLLLALILFGTVSATVPQVRRRVGPTMDAVLGPVVGWLEPHLRALPNVMLTWSAKNEARNIARRLRDRELAGEPMPAPEELDRFLVEEELSGSGGHDPWGRSYFVSLSPDSIIVGSPGPDHERGTPDDVRVSYFRP